jgi:Na+/proline symporter
MVSWLLCIVLAYFVLLLLVAYRTSRHSNNETFFIGNRSSNWMLVAFGMIGTSLSGVTFISVPGTVGDFGEGGALKAFSYFQVVIGYLLGYFVVAFVLLPLYYRMRLTSIYHYLRERLGAVSYRTGALFFILSRTVGATARLYLVINVLQLFLLDSLGVPFAVTTVIILSMILLYTLEGGVKTIVWTDTLQTTFMLLGLVVGVIYILGHLHVDLGTAWASLKGKGFTKVFNTDIRSRSFFVKQILGGAFITIAMTGLDQEMMQKNISVHRLGDSQKNMMTFSIVMVAVNALFLLLGGLLYLYAFSQGGVYSDHGLLLGGKHVTGDDLFPSLALHYFSPAIALIFIIGLISALFPSADGALTALTSSFCIDLLDLQNRADMDEKRKKRRRMTVHLCFALVFLLCILIFRWINNKSIINIILDLAGYTYGPLLGLFAFGIFTRRSLKYPRWVPAVCLLSPVLSYLLSRYSATWSGGYRIGIELLIINGLLTYIGLFLLSETKKSSI